MSTSRAPIQVVQAERDEASVAFQWFASSSWDDGRWYKVSLVPGQSLTCSCRHGSLEAMRAKLGTATGQPCRHIVAVTDHVQAQREAMAS